MQPKATLIALAAFMSAGFPAPTIASELAPPTVPLAIVATVEPVAESIAVADEDLLDLRGGQALVIANQTMTAINTGSVLNGDYTAGSISFSDSALANFNGFGNVVVNTGAQNNLQSGLNLTINIAN